MFEFDAASLLASFVITWSIGLLPPLLIRYAFVKRPLMNWPAIGVCATFWIFNVFLFTALRSQSKTHAALLLVAIVSYWILTTGPSADDLARDREKTEQLKRKIEEKGSKRGA